MKNASILAPPTWKSSEAAVQLDMKCLKVEDKTYFLTCHRTYMPSPVYRRADPVRLSGPVLNVILFQMNNFLFLRDYKNTFTKHNIPGDWVTGLLQHRIQKVR